MIANPTTLILGAGASAPVYPTGAELRDRIISGAGAKPYERYFQNAQEGHNAGFEEARYAQLKARLQRSHITSVDAFLAEPENAKLAEVGHIAIAAALLPCEARDKFPDWYPALFNAIRFRGVDERTEKLRVITFNYDLSLEFFLFHAFQNAYGLTAEQAREVFNASVEIIHVYGELGELRELSDSNKARDYGADLDMLGPIINASARIKLIGRHDETKDAFVKAFDAIRNASFVAILGYGFDALNNQNLRLQEAVANKHPFATGFGMGSGARSRLNSLAHQSRMLMGSKTETVKAFLDETDFLSWINVPHAKASDVSRNIMKVFEHGWLPYTR
jgi:hypothetical protein